MSYREAPRRWKGLVNWGFAAAGAGPLAHLDPDLPAEPLPYPDRPLV